MIWGWVRGLIDLHRIPVKGTQLAFFANSCCIDCIFCSSTALAWVILDVDFMTAEGVGIPVISAVECHLFLLFGGSYSCCKSTCN